MQNSSIRFFKIITRTDLDEDGKLRFPNSFTKKHGGDMPNPLFLKPPDGKEWKIYWNKHEGDIWLQKGWKEFAKYYTLAHGHMVLFESQENFLFSVQIFNKSTLEIKYPFHGSDQEEKDNQINEEISIDILDEQPPTKMTRTRPKSQSPCSQPLKKLRSDPSENVGKSSKLRNLPKRVQIEESIQGNEANLIDLARIPKDENKTTIIHRGGKETLRTSLWTNPHSITNEGRKESNKFTSENPFFVVDIKPNRSGDYRPFIPGDFLRKYLNKKHVVSLKFGKKLWPVKLYLMPCSKRTKLSGGWQLFSRENKLQGGDVCVFELINREDNVLDVHIYRDSLESAKCIELNKIRNN